MPTASMAGRSEWRGGGLTERPARLGWGVVWARRHLGTSNWSCHDQFEWHTERMSASRLVAALLMLQRNGQITARELAAELEVSEKTARRDLEALGAAGFPVYSQAGRGGGWRLLGEA